jgi:hypothetical protein
VTLRAEHAQAQRRVGSSHAVRWVRNVVQRSGCCLSACSISTAQQLCGHDWLGIMSGPFGAGKGPARNCSSSCRAQSSGQRQVVFCATR